MLASFETLLDETPGLVIGVAVLAALLVIAFVIWWWRYRQPASLEKTLESLSLERLSNVVLPKADEGEIHIEHVLLTAGGIYVVDTRDLRGIVFGSDKMRDWTVLDNGRRYTIANPQGPLFDRVAAVRQIVSGVPVKGCIVFGNEAQFTKGRPAHVYTEANLREELPQLDESRIRQLRASFDAQWQKLRDAAFSGV